MQRKTRRMGLVLGIFAVSVLAASALMSMRPEPPKKEVENIDPLVEVIELRESTESFVIRSQGTVKPRTRTTLSAEVSGAIVSISPDFIPGGVFGKNEVLMRIDPSDYAAAVDRTEALVVQRQIEYDGARKLRLQGYRAEAELASAAAALAAAKAELISARRNLERTHIRLPYEGMVLQKSADLGQYVNPGTQLGVTFATDIAEVRLPLTDQDLAFLDVPMGAAAVKGEPPLVTLSAIQKGRRAEWQGHVVRSEGVVDERSRVTYVVAQVEDPYRLHGDGTPLPIGTFVAASIATANAMELIRVPRSALRGSSQLLFVDDENRIQIRTVSIVRADSDYAYLDSGASPGERITITPIEAPTNGLVVRTEARPAAEAAGTNSKVASQLDED